MRVLVWGGDSWANQGDAAVLDGTLRSLQAMQPGAKIVVASDQPNVTEARYSVAAVQRASWQFLWTLWRADLVLWGGGQLIQNDSSKLFLVVQLCFLTLCFLLYKPVVCYAQGVGPVHGAISQRLLRLSLARLQLITVRDTASAERLVALGVPIDRVQVTADPSFCVPAADGEVVNATLERLGITEPFVILAPRRWGHYRSGWLPVRWSRGQTTVEHERQHDALCNALAATCDYLSNEHGVQVVLLPMCPGGDQDDDIVAQGVCRRMFAPAKVLGEVLPTPVLKGVLGRAEMVVAMRTHAAMLAAAASTPVASVSYQGKGEALMSELGLDYVLPIEEVSADRVQTLAERTWSDREAIHLKLRCIVPELEQRAAQTSRVAVREAQSSTSLRLGSAYRAHIAPAVGFSAEGQTLEIGSADGRLSDRIGTQDWVALDLVPERVGVSTAGWVQGDALRAPFANATFDTVVAFDVLEHVADDRGLVREIARLVRPGGVVWVSVPSRTTAIFPPFLTEWAHRQWSHVRPGYTEPELRTLFEDVGKVSITQWNEPAYRASYLGVKLLSLIAPGLALGVLRGVAWVDEQLQTGSAGHYFVRVRVAGTDR